MRGDPQLIPIGNSIIYVRPIFVQGKDSFPRWNYVAVTYGENAVLDQTGVSDAVVHLLDNTQPPVETGGGPVTPTSPPTTPTTTPPGGATVQSLLQQAQALFNSGNKALANQDLATYQDDYKKAVSLVNEAATLAAQTPSTTPGSSTSTSTSTSTTTTTPKSKTTTSVAHI